MNDDVDRRKKTKKNMKKYNTSTIVRAFQYHCDKITIFSWKS